jgi:hypothetical protein
LSDPTNFLTPGASGYSERVCTALPTERIVAMRLTGFLTCALLATAAIGGPASAANICQAEKMTCATTMPAGGYCECTAHGATQGGTVVEKAAPHRSVNSTAGGCGANPKGPGCS